jgi:hypothetical protein
MLKESRKKLQMILEGWKNLVTTNTEIEKIANERAIICAKCTHLSKLLFCKKCGCFVPAAIRSKDKKCKLEKW